MSASRPIIVTVSISRAYSDGPPIFAWSLAEASLIGDDGRVAVFASVATNRIPGDTNDKADAFLRFID